MANAAQNAQKLEAEGKKLKPIMEHGLWKKAAVAEQQQQACECIQQGIVQRPKGEGGY